MRSLDHLLLGSSGESVLIKYADVTYSCRSLVEEFLIIALTRGSQPITSRYCTGTVALKSDRFHGIKEKRPRDRTPRACTGPGLIWIPAPPVSTDHARRKLEINNLARIGVILERRMPGRRIGDSSSTLEPPGANDPCSLTNQVSPRRIRSPRAFRQAGPKTAIRGDVRPRRPRPPSIDIHFPEGLVEIKIHVGLENAKVPRR